MPGHILEMKTFLYFLLAIQKKFVYICIYKKPLVPCFGAGCVCVFRITSRDILENEISECTLRISSFIAANQSKK